jgi:hypothetical protein
MSDIVKKALKRWVPKYHPRQYGVIGQDVQELCNEITRLTARVAELEGALRFYANGENWSNPFGMSSIIYDGGKIARAALSQPAPPQFTHAPEIAAFSAAQEPLGAEIERIWDANADKLYEGADAPAAWRPGREASAAAFLLEAIRAGRVEPFDAVDTNVERLAIEYSSEGGDAVMVLETAETFMIAGLEAIVNAYAPVLPPPPEKGGK